jgi:DtxR family Mn-dependent transcriptional regulator
MNVSKKKAAVRSAERESESVDDYIKAIYTLGADFSRQVGSSELAKHLGVAPASVTNMLQRLAEAKRSMVVYERHRGVSLSATGRRRALELVRHHRLIETFLFEVLGYGVEELHDEAERLEHFISEAFEDRVAEKLGDPVSDPHGHCIPSKNGKMPPRHRVSCACGSTGV